MLFFLFFGIGQAAGSAVAVVGVGRPGLCVVPCLALAAASATCFVFSAACFRYCVRVCFRRDGAAAPALTVFQLAPAQGAFPLVILPRKKGVVVPRASLNDRRQGGTEGSIRKVTV